GGPGQRWWDGYAWTDATVLPERPPPPPPAPAPPPAAGQAAQVPWAAASERLATFNTGALVDAELRMARAGRVAVAVPAACAIANLVITRLNEDRLLAYGSYFRVVWHDTQNHITPPQYTGPSTLTPANLVVSLILLAGAVVALVWQHRAASAGRALGIRSGMSPAWGVGCWFVPIVNFWMPYLAVRDCLPPGDPHRARVLLWWIAWLVAEALGVAAAISALFSSGTALALSVPAALAYVAVVAWAPGIVSAIAAAHRQAMERLSQAHAGPGGAFGVS
ncbi:MAG TPA: DUF4328 domain-containing protein, partial [Acidimicrobiales bacterium]|nr:DUF4328 domain-containing protein [Acidimicrobiales bacterium]